MKTIKWILFDLSGVVVSWTFINPSGYTVGTRYFSPEDFDGFFTSKDHHEYALGLLSHEQIVSRFIKRKKLDISVEEVNSIIQTEDIPVPGMQDLIKRLAENYSIALATNGGKEITRMKIEKSGILSYLSKVVASYRLRLLKPNTAFYKKMCEIIEAKPEECVFIDDDQPNVDAAHSVGMKGILFTDVPKLEAELKKLNI